MSNLQYIKINDEKDSLGIKPCKETNRLFISSNTLDFKLEPVEVRELIEFLEGALMIIGHEDSFSAGISKMYLASSEDFEKGGESNFNLETDTPISFDKDENKIVNDSIRKYILENALEIKEALLKGKLNQDAEN